MRSFKLMPRLMLLGLSGLIIGLDQLSKAAVRQHLQLYQIKAFLPHWNWTLVYNEGAAFSFLADQSGWQKIIFTLLAMVVAVGLIYYIVFKSYNVLAGLAYGCILGGALGNVIDRLVAGKVTDFIDWFVSGHHWPAFNLADSCISIGVSLLLIDHIFFTPKQA